MEKVVLTFNEKVGDILMSLGLIILMSVAFVLLVVLLSWLSGFEISISGMILTRVLLVSATAGIVLVKLSFLTIPKVKK